MTQLGIGLIGTGYMGKCHALAWTSVHAVFGDVPRIALVHLSEVTDELAKTRAGELGFKRATSNWRALVADPDVDVVSITTPNQFHAEMAVAALEAGKHVWCEKPMATSIADATRMRDAARASDRVAILGYNYIQNPIIRQIEALVRDGEIGRISHIRVEMDEDYMADPDAPFTWKSEAASGHGALDDFGVHPLSLITTMFGPLARVVCQQAKPYERRPSSGGRTVETYDIASCLFELQSGTTGLIALSRSAWGRKGRIALQIHGDRGSILFDQERFNEFQLFKASDPANTAGFRTILAAPIHPPYGRFVPSPGHSLGFNDLKVIECRELLASIAGAPSRSIDFERGLDIELAVEAMARSAERRAWVDIPVS